MDFGEPQDFDSDTSAHNWVSIKWITELSWTKRHYWARYNNDFGQSQKKKVFTEAWIYPKGALKEEIEDIFIENVRNNDSIVVITF
jgi:hypothetical protein